MAKPPSLPPATSRPAIPDRAVTAPELAAALNEVSVLDHRRQFSVAEDAERNGIDGLGGQRTNVSQIFFNFLELALDRRHRSTLPSSMAVRLVWRRT